MLDQKLEILFLRIYAKNLNRSYRSDPANACSDAEIQMSSIILIVAFALFLTVGSIVIPVSLTLFLNSSDLKYGALIAVVIAVAYGVHKRFGRFEYSPEIARRYDTAKDHRWAQIGYWGVMVGFLIVAVIVLGHWRS
jgi:hypothetical protein